ncbi:hypothetical protein [Arthrobacter sp. 8AJ]|uniref:hypothetical protein n=1 Tax=Arthrobacter sp. 8AJ TaxID=2653130 RepID=UPI0012F2DDA9|nr:hypothetical protein [Arthrobacter sp. 8AJ]VXC57019.1 conserved exported hypothetical protein [Arthrobacter sp. 8AJ]
MRKMTKKNKIAAVAASAALVAVGGGAAYAYWSTTGGGNGSAAASQGTSPITINVTVAPGVAPGTPKGITYTATNPNSSSTPVTLAKPVVTTSSDACLPAWFSATAPTGTTTVLGNADGTALGTGTLTLNDDPAVNQDACKNATITVTVASN